VGKNHIAVAVTAFPPLISLRAAFEREFVNISFKTLYMT
jgi:hypothetical protein